MENLSSTSYFAFPDGVRQSDHLSIRRSFESEAESRERGSTGETENRTGSSLEANEIRGKAPANGRAVGTAGRGQNRLTLAFHDLQLEAQSLRLE